MSGGDSDSRGQTLQSAWMPTSRSLAEEYHRLTKYSDKTLKTSHSLDWSRQPRPFKEIVSQRKVSLRPWLPFSHDPFTGEPLAPPPPPLGGGIGLLEISRLLFHGYGVTGIMRYEQGGGQALRASPSAGALYPTEVYVAVRDVPELEAGLYNYQPHTHELVPLWDGDHLADLQQACNGSAAFQGARVCLLLTGIWWRSGWRYQERGYRRVLLDTGHVLANLVAYAPHEHCTILPHAGFVDAALNGLFFFDDASEAVLVCAPVHDETAESEPGALLQSPTTRGAKPKVSAFAEESDVAESATVHLHRASSCPPGAPVANAPVPDSRVATRALPLSPPGDIDAGVPAAILRRRSAREYRMGAIPLEQLASAIGFAFGRGDEHGIGRPVFFPTREAGLLEARVVVNAVEGLAPGIYAVEGPGAALLPHSMGDFRDEIRRVTLGQEIAGRAAATVVLTSALKPAVALYGDRAYRYLHLDAGSIGERLQLAAVAQGLGACGIGGFLDDDLGKLVGIEKDEIVLYLVTLGQSG